MRIGFVMLLFALFASSTSAAVSGHKIEHYPWPEPPQCTGRDKLPPGRLSGFAEGVGKPAFTKHYSLSLNLPMPEERLLDIADSLNLQIVLLRDGPDALCAHRPERQAVNDDTIRKVYYLLDGSTVDSGSTHVRYAAYVNGNGMVVYIEPDFSYDGL
jgi:hypothetical protein